MKLSIQSPRSLIILAVLTFLAISILAPNASATIEVKANLSNANVEHVYAIATSPSGILLTIQMKLNKQTGLFEGKSSTTQAGNYNVTITASSGESSASITIPVIIGNVTITRVDVTPSPANVIQGTKNLFAALPYDSNGNYVDPIIYKDRLFI